MSAQSGGSFTTSCTALKTGVSDVIEVSYTVRDIAEIETISPGAFKDFVVVGGPYLEQYSYSNGRAVSEESILKYQLQPRRSGTLTIPSATARDRSGRSFQSNTLIVQAVPGSTRPAQPRQSVPQARQQTQNFDPFDDPFFGHSAAMAQQRSAPRPAPREDLSREIFLRVEVDKTSVTVGEPVIASYKLFTRLPTEARVTKMPVLNGFWSEDFPVSQRPQPVSQMVNGRGYQTFLLKKIALYPTEAGTLTLDPAFAEGVVHMQRAGDSDPFGGMVPDDAFFNQTFSADAFGDYIYETIPVFLRSRPVIITAVAAPSTARPAGWDGAVGQFSVSSRLQTPAISEEDEAILQIIVRGSGNIKLLRAPALNLPPGIESMESGVKDTSFGNSGEKGRIFSYVLSADTAGSFRIPPVSFYYYDPEAKRYRTANTASSVQLLVKEMADTRDRHPPELAAANESAAPDNIAAGIIGKAPLTSSPLFWTICAVSLATLFFFIWRRRQREEEEAEFAIDAPVKSTTAVVTESPKQLLIAAQLSLSAGRHDAFYRYTSSAVSSLLGTILNGAPVTQMARQSLAMALAARGVSLSVSSSAIDVLQACDTALYAPAGTAPDSAAAQAVYLAAENCVNSLSSVARGVAGHK